MASPAHAKGQHGTFVTLDAGGEFLILPAGISLAGTVTGTYYELINQNLVSFGFLRAPNGNFTTIDSPGSAALGAAVINRPGPNLIPSILTLGKGSTGEESQPVIEANPDT